MSATIEACSCGGSIQNFGKPGCLSELGFPRSLVIAQRKKDDGTDNFLDLTQTLDSTYIDEFFLAEDDDNRYIIIPGIKAYTPEQAEALTDESPYGDIDNIRDGISSMMFEFRGGDIYKDLAKWNAVGCLDLMVYLIDDKGNLLGKCESGDNFGGLLVGRNSFQIIPIPHNGSDNVNKYTVKFNLELGSGFDKVDYIGFDDFTSVNLVTAYDPLRDVNVKITGITATTIDFKLFLDYGSAKKRSVKGVTGLTDSDLQLWNVDDGALVAFATLVEPATPDGSYSGTFASQDSTEVVYVDPILNVKEPLSLNRLPSVTAIIP